MIYHIESADIPGHIQHISGAPKQLYIKANDTEAFIKLMRRPRVAIVGSRKMSPYGQQVAEQLAGQLAAHGVVIVSGLAIGVDAIAHRAALAAKGLTMAVLPSPLENIYPRMHGQLAQQILDNQGALVSEYPIDSITYKTNFVARNRIVTGLSSALLIIEAAENSGTLHTARFALEQGIELLAVPGNITSPTSVGTNNLIKTGAHPVTNVRDILHLLDVRVHSAKVDFDTRVSSANADEQCLLDLIEQGVNNGSELLDRSGFGVEKFSHNLTMLEITAKVRSLGANQWALS